MRVSTGIENEIPGKVGILEARLSNFSHENIIILYNWISNVCV